MVRVRVNLCPITWQICLCVCVCPYCKYWMSASSHGFCSTCSPEQWWPPPLGAGLLQLRVLDLWPPEQDPHEDQQLQLPWITPERENRCGSSVLFVVLTGHHSNIKLKSWPLNPRPPNIELNPVLSCLTQTKPLVFVCLPGCSPITAPFSQACPEVPGRQTQRHSEPVSSGWPLFWQGRQWQGCSSARYSSVALFRWTFFKPAHCTSFTSSYRGRSWKTSLPFFNVYS